ncbi:DUF397 domain-containing protein [Streptomyces sp. B1866]|uniref:DUF397 domain-containing protein n=1 Tax=Streptomyces sp. B1866 TaxID=3075431 RepID=UPI0028912646|nr:DUF397 domain-containing protein [Streptomyces sp. B1866]MDT3396921.1 DUF397 domain-containing protein [Streptomyces sp. B1866]
MNPETHILHASALTGWRKSSYSGPGDDIGPDNCLEVADGHPGAVPVRDSKDPHGPALLFGPASWSSFVTALRGGELPGA